MDEKNKKVKFVRVLQNLKKFQEAILNLPTILEDNLVFENKK